MTTVATTDRAAALAEVLAAAGASIVEAVVAGPVEPATGPEPGATGRRLAVGTVGQVTILGLSGDEALDAFIGASDEALTDAFGAPAGQGEPADEPGDTFAPGSAGFRIPLDVLYTGELQEHSGAGRTTGYR